MTMKRRDVNRARRFTWDLDDVRFTHFGGKDVDPNDEAVKFQIL